MGLALGLFLGLGVITVIAYPLLKSRRAAGGRNAADASQQAMSLARDELRRQLLRLESDRASDLVEEQDFRAQLEELRVSAALLPGHGARFRRRVYDAAQLERDIALARATLAEGNNGSPGTGHPASNIHRRQAP